MIAIFPPVEGGSLALSSRASDVTAAAQARLDDEIAALTLLLCNLRTRRNAFSLVSRLPPEILAAIFIHCASGCHQERYRERGVPDWVNVSYVCRHWRDVALHCATLWTFLFACSQCWTDELLARSKTAPLSVRMDSRYPKQTEAFNLAEKVAPHADRIQDLCLQLTRREAERILPKLSLPAPLLQNLQISVAKSSYLGEPVLVPAALFDGDTPALRRLELTNYSFPLSSPTLSGLTSLRLRDLGPSFQPTLVELKAALSRMRHLAHLHLENALPRARDVFIGQSRDDSEKLSLPQLSRLSILAPFSTVVLLVSCLDLPLKTEVRLRCSFEGNPEDYTPIYPLLASRFSASKDQALSLVPIIRTSFIETTSATVGFIFSTAERDSNRHPLPWWPRSHGLDNLHEEWDCNIPLKVDMVLPASLTKDREDLVGGVCRSISLTGLRSAHFNFDIGTTLSSAFWEDTFGHLQELQHIQLTEVSLQGLVQVLSLAPHHWKNEDETPEQGSGQIFAPALEELELDSVEFSKECYGRSEGNPDICSCSASCLYDALSNREEEGYGLERVAFTECMYVYTCDVEDLKEVVTDVDWDGIIRTTSDYEYEEDEEEEEDEEDDYGSFGVGYFNDFY